MYTSPLEAPPVRLTPSASIEKSRDNGFSDLLRDRNTTNQTTPPRAEEPRPRDPRSEDSRADDNRPRGARTDTTEEANPARPATDSRTAEPKPGTEAETDARAPLKDAAAKDDAEPTGSEQPPAENTIQRDNASEPEAVTAPPNMNPAEAVEDLTALSAHTTQTFTDALPDDQQMLEAAANTTAAGVSTDLTGAPGKTLAADSAPNAAAFTGETTAAQAPAGGDLITSQPATVIPETAAGQPGDAAPQITTPQSAARNETASISGIIPSPANNATATENAATSPLAAVAAKPVVGVRDGSPSAAATSPTTMATMATAANNGATPLDLPLADAEGDFEAALTATSNSQGAKTGTGQSSAPAANATPSTGSPDASASASKPAEVLLSADNALPRIPDALPPAAASNNAPNTGPTAGLGNELRIVSDASPLAETAAARTTPNAVASQLAVQINRAVVDGQDKIVINLKPGTLGRVSINLEVGHDNRLIAVISVEKPDTLEFLQRDARTLERALQEAGIKTDSGSLSFNLQGQGADESPFDDFSNDGPFAALPRSDEDVDSPISSSTTAAYAASASGVDIHV